MQRQKTILVTGGCGYVGGNLVPCLLARGYQVRSLVREPRCLEGKFWSSQVETIIGDVLVPGTLERAMQGVSVAYYLIHSMDSGKKYVERDNQAAHIFAQAASAAGLERIIYLGGLADSNARIARHMQSRIQTGEILRMGSVPVTELRASLIIGPGSASFEMIRYLTEWFPILIGPAWLRNHTQPISIQDLLEYLLNALDNPDSRGKVIEIGGRDVLTYQQTMLIYAQLRGLKRWILTFKSIPVSFMARVVGWLTPISRFYAKPLIEGLMSDSVVKDPSASTIFPTIQTMDYQSAVSKAVDLLSPIYYSTNSCPNKDFNKAIKQDGFIINCRQVWTDVQSRRLFRTLLELGGGNGWLFANFLWKLRGVVDRLIGGPGMRYKTSGEFVKGSVVDYYRVELIEPDRRLLLRSELKTPGVGWMEWLITESKAGTLLVQKAYFAPKGLAGFLYWYLLTPLHLFVFSGLMRRIIREARQNTRLDRSNTRKEKSP